MARPSSAERARRLGGLALLSLAALVRAAPAGERAEVFTLDPARVVPATEHARPVLLVAVAPETRESRRFEAEVLGHEDVRAVLARDWLCARVEAPLPDSVARTYEVGVLPAVVVLDRLGGFVRRIEGERPVDVLLSDLEAALAEAREQEAATRAALVAEGSLEERVARAQLLLRRGLAARAVPGLEAIAALDARNEQGAGLFALAKLAAHAYRSGDLARGDAGLARVGSLAPASAQEATLRRERFADARAELARLAAGLSPEEKDLLAVEDAALLRAEGRAAEARASLEATWDRASGPARAAAEAALDEEGPSGAPGDWRVLRDGRRLVQRMGCAECHAIEPAVALDAAASCVQCHRSIAKGEKTLAEKKEALAFDPHRYSAQRNIRHYLHAPDLGTAGVRLRREWVRRFLRRPVDVRPFLEESMPRLPLSDGEVELVLDYLEVVARRAAGPLETVKVPAGSVAKGEALFRAKGCVACHLFGNRELPGGPAARPWPRAVRAEVRAAPNLRWARDRARRDVLPLWIRDPRRFSKETPMPAFELSDAEMGDLLAFIEKGDLGAPAPMAEARSLDSLRSLEANGPAAREVFLDTCKHCHLKDETGGIGNAGGGFGYAPIGLDLETPSGPRRGSVGPDGRRRPAPFAQRLAWRRDENRWDAWAPYRDPLVPVPEERYDHPPGMPLGLPALDDREADLVRRFVGE